MSSCFALSLILRSGSSGIVASDSWLSRGGFFAVLRSTPFFGKIPVLRNSGENRGKTAFTWKKRLFVRESFKQLFLFSLFRFHAHSDTRRLYIALFMYKCFSTNSVNFICAQTLCFKLRFASFFCFFSCFLVLRSSPAHQIAPEEVSSEALGRMTS